MNAVQEKLAAASRAALLVEPGMIVGLGSGSTAEVVIERLGARYREGLRFTGVATSGRSASLAASYGIPVVDLDDHRRLDLALDGADEVDPNLNCIKGHGGQLLREKIVAAAADRFVVVVDSSKSVSRLGVHAPVPVEIIPFGWTTTAERVQSLGFVCERRGGNAPYITAGQNFILDCTPGAGLDLADLTVASAIKAQVGVVEHGLFLGIAHSVIYGVGDSTKVVNVPRTS
ncbi:MAG: ribose-5-phosphate isomerase RpiA [Chloroflexota bacterium]